MSKLILEGETHRILGACFEVYKEKGCGFVEPVYQACLELELASQGIEFLAQQEISPAAPADLPGGLGLLGQGDRRNQGGQRPDR